PPAGASTPKVRTTGGGEGAGSAPCPAQAASAASTARARTSRPRIALGRRRRRRRRPALAGVVRTPVRAVDLARSPLALSGDTDAVIVVDEPLVVGALRRRQRAERAVDAG